MSRSYRKFAVIKDRCRHSNDFMKPKTKANRMVRRTKDVPQHSGFKKVYCSWNISDYKFIGVQSETELRSGWLKNDIRVRPFYDTYKEAYKDWKKHFKCK